VPVVIADPSPKLQFSSAHAFARCASLEATATSLQSLLLNMALAFFLAILAVPRMPTRMIKEGSSADGCLEIRGQAPAAQAAARDEMICV
jgi:hypothetical protein